MLEVVLLLPLSMSMYNGELDHGGCGLAAASAVAVALVAEVEENYRQKRPATRASTDT